jgi:FkbM family methyltransferase
LRENVTLNGYRNVIVENKAVVDRSGPVRLSQNDRQPLSHVESIVSGPGLEIAAVSLNDYFDSSSYRIDFAKIDVEGAELRVLDGMSRIIEKDHPILLIELHDMSTCGHEALLRLVDAGYTVSFLDHLKVRAHVLAKPKQAGD